jgi:antitoxin component of MazEF toxin-antitoxin module
MSSYTATVIQTGNSIALRVPKQYAVDAKLSPGQKVTLRLPTKQKQQDHAKIKRLIKNLQQITAYASVADPVAWQQELRQDRPLPGRK